MYCTEADLRQILKSDLLAQLVKGEPVGTPDEAQSRLSEIILQATADADAEIDGYLAKQVPVPLVRVPAVIAKCAKDIAAYNLVSRIGVGKDDDRENNYRKRYEDAIRFLGLASKGTVELGLSPPAAQASAGFRIDGPERLFSRDSLKGM